MSEAIFAQQKEEAHIGVEMRAAHKRTRGTHDTERHQEEIAFHSIDVDAHRIKKIQKDSLVRGIKPTQKEKVGQPPPQSTTRWWSPIFRYRFFRQRAKSDIAGQ